MKDISCGEFRREAMVTVWMMIPWCFGVLMYMMKRFVLLVL